MNTMKNYIGNETWKGLVRHHVTRAAMMLVMMAMTLTAGARTVTLTSSTGQVTLNDGDVVTGTGGANTYLVISAGATVTLSGVDITNNTRDIENEIPSGIVCQGNATIILAKGTTNTIIGGFYLDPCIKVGPPNTTLTIKGYGTLYLRSWGWGACIGSRNQQACGNIVIEGGTLDLKTEMVYNGEHYSGYAACIGSSGHGGSCGDITISGGNIRAISSFGAAAIGSGAAAHSGFPNMVPVSSTCDNINITGGTIYAYSFSVDGGASIGGGYDGHCGNISISGVTNVSALKYAEYSPYCIGPGAGDNSTCGTLTLWGQTSDYIVGPTDYGTEVLAPTDIPYTVRFNANGGTGSMADQGFYSNTPQALTANGFSLSGKAFKCWSTEADGSGYDFYNGETVTNLGNVTLYAQWANTDYVVSFDKNSDDAFGTMAGQNFAMNTTQALNANNFVYPGYAFAEWNTMQDGSGTSYTDKQSVSNLGNVTLYAQWTPTTYTITYIDAVNGTDNVTNTNPTNYAYMDNAITLAEPTRVGYTFDGWTYKGQDSPTKSVTIAQGTYGDLTFTAHWTESSDAVITENTGYYELQNGQTLSGTGGAYTHITIADGATVTLSGVNITAISNSEYNPHRWAGITCEGNATIILADETTNNLKGGYMSYPGISVPQGKTLTIQGSGTLFVSSNGNGPGIGPDGYYGGYGNITIEGGTIIATGGWREAGIGGLEAGYCGNVTITDGVTSVTATAGWGASYSIGSHSGTVTIGGIETGNISISPYTYKPSETTICTVTFNANGGQGAMDSQTLYSNIPQALAVNSFTREDYVFLGWNTEADGSGTSYTNGQTVINTGSVTLYAQWHANYDVNFNANGGTGIMASQHFIWNTSQALTANTFTRAGYAFTGWNTEANGSGTAYNDGQTVSNLDNTTLYAQWVTSLDMTLAENANNAEIIGEKNGQTFRTLTLSGRRLFKDGNWNTLCLPFAMSEAQIAASPLAGCILMELDGTTSNLTSGTLTLNFKNATSIEAGKPYIVKWITEVTDITSMPFFDLTDEEFNSLGFVGFTPLCLDGQGFSFPGSSYGPEKLVDGRLNTTYITSNANPWVEFYFDYAPITPKGYAIWTAEDNEGAYNPKSWTIKAQNNYESDWTTLVTVDNTDGDKLPMANSKRTVFALDNNRSFDTFRFEATKGSRFQLAELQFCTVQPSLSMQHNLHEPETISTDAEWETFADNVNNGTKTYQGAKVQLAADINVSTMVGTSDHPFQGTFDGCGHTLKLSITDESNQGTAPFRYISGATIRNVKTTGTVTGNLHCAGLVGFAKEGTNIIKNCEVAASVVCSGGDHSHCGGILGHGLSSSTTINDCLFSGSISGATTATGIIYGWGDNGNHTIENCLAAGTYTDCGGIELLRKNEGTENINNCYHKGSGGSQGTDANLMTNEELVTALGSGWEVICENVLPKKNADFVDAQDNIVGPVFTGVTIDASASTTVDFDGGQFVGTYNPVTLTVNDPSNLFLGADNKLYYPNDANNADGKFHINSCRAYFHIGNPNAIKNFVLNFDGETDGVRSMNNGQWTMDNGAGAWYDLGGRKISDTSSIIHHPSSLKKGVYIHGGRKVVVK